MKLSRAIDLGRSLRKVFGGNPGSEAQVKEDQERQTRTAKAILARFFGANENHRRELVLLADKVGLGKTYVALAVAATILDRIRQGEAPEGLPANRPVVLVLTPNNDALYNKWLREADGFRHDCEREGERLDWLRVERPLTESSKSGNVIHMTAKIRQATRSQPVLLIAKLGVLARRCTTGTFGAGTPWPACSRRARSAQTTARGAAARFSTRVARRPSRNCSTYGSQIASGRTPTASPRTCIGPTSVRWATPHSAPNWTWHSTTAMARS